MKNLIIVLSQWAINTARMVALFIACLLPVFGSGLELTNDAATGEPGKFAAEEILREATAKGMTAGAGNKRTRVALTVEKDDKAADHR